MQHDEEAGKPAGQADVQEVNRRNFLQWIPRQIGPPTEYARNVTHWMNFILGSQLLFGLLRLFYLVDFLGSFWMFGVIATGVYARQEMNIQIICIWGLVCLLNGLLDVLAMIIPLAFGLLSLNVLAVMVRVCTPVSELLGAAFAWNLYCDFLEERGEKPPYSNPFKRFFRATDPVEKPLDAARMAKQEVKSAIGKAKPESQQPPAHGSEQSPLAKQQHGEDYGAAAGGGPPGFEGHHHEDGKPAQGHPRDTSVFPRIKKACCA